MEGKITCYTEEYVDNLKKELSKHKLESSKRGRRLGKMLIFLNTTWWHELDRKNVEDLKKIIMGEDD